MPLPPPPAEALIRTGKPINELKTVAESTLAAIMGRMSTYTGKSVSWEDALNSTENLVPAKTRHVDRDLYLADLQALLSLLMNEHGVAGQDREP